MAKSEKKGGSASKMAEGNVKLGEIQTAASSTMEPRSYARGYPIQPDVVIPGQFSLKGRRSPGKE